MTFNGTQCAVGSNVFSNCSMLTVYCLDYSVSALKLVDENVHFELISNSVADSNEAVLDREGTYYVTNTVSAMANGYVTMNLAYKIKETAGDITNKTLKIRIPTDLSLIEKTLMLDGVRVTGYTFKDNLLTIAVSNTSGQLSFCLKPQKDSRVSTYAVMSYKSGNQNKQEIISIINEDIPLLSIQVDSEISSNIVSVTGVGPADTDVSVYVDGVLSKTVRTNKTGTYTARISIAEPKNYKTYTISAKTMTAEGEAVAYKDIKYCAGSPALTGLTMQYSAHGSQAYDLMSAGTVMPTISFEPGKDFTFNVKFTNPDRIDTVYVCSTRSNVTKRIQAVWNEVTETYVAQGSFDPNNKGYVPGTITVEYSPVRDPINFLTGNIDYTSDRYVNGSSDPIKAALAGKLEDCIKDLHSDDKQISGLIKLIDVNAQLDFNIMTDIIPSYLDPQNAGAYGYEAIEDDLGAKVYLKVAEYGEDKVRGQIVDFAREKITDFCIEGGYINLDTNINTYFSFVEALGYADTLVTWDNNRVSLNESKQAILASNMSDTQKAEALKKLDNASKANNGVVAAMALQIILSAAGIAIPFPASLILPLLSMQNENYVKGVLGQFGYLNASQTEGAQFKIRWIIDPSGYVYDNVTNERLEGVKVTAYHIPFDEEDETFWDAPKTENSQIWDATEWDQVNPLYTDANGRYAWDVPEGWWRVKYEKDGYETTWSEWLPVPPPQTEVNIGMTPVKTYTIGDVNGDGRINGTDVSMLRRYIAGGYGIQIETQAADINNDGRINGTDVSLLRRYIAGGYGVELNP